MTWSALVPKKMSAWIVVLVSMAILALGLYAAFNILPDRQQDEILNIQDVVSPSGVKAWLVEDHSVPVIALKFAFKGAGAAGDPVDKQGLARMASNTMDEGAGNLDSTAFQKALRDLVIDLHFSADRDNFGGTLKTLTANKDRAFALLQMALNHPRFDEEPVERMRRANQSRIRSALSDPEWIAARLLSATAFSGHPYAQNSGGTLSTLERITSADLRVFSRALSRDRLVVAVAGDITAAELARILDFIFGGLPGSVSLPSLPAARLTNAGRTVLYQKDIPQTVIEMIQPGIDVRDPDYQGAQVMNFILGSSGFGSRLTREIREERGLTYGVYSSFVDMDKFDGLGASTSTRNESVAETLSLIKAEWNKMRDVPVSPRELEDAKSYLVGSLPLSLTSTDDIAGLLLSLQIDSLPIDYLGRRQKAIEAVRAEDVQRIARRILDPAALVTILVGDPVNVADTQKVEVLPDVE
jgi:zinc protease